MPYDVNIKLSAPPQKRKPLPFETLIDIIKDVTSLKFNEAKKLVNQLVEGKEVKLIPRDARDIDAAFKLTHRLEQMGFIAKVEYWVVDTDLPYLVNAEGKIEGSEKVLEREWSVEEVERLLQLWDIQLVVTGYGYQMEWIPSREKYSFWDQKIRSQLIDHQNSQSRNDYPLYTATEWVAKSNVSYIFLWTLH